MPRPEPTTCPKCKQLVTLTHLHDTAHGVPGTHMKGTERYECPLCGWTVYRAEGEKLGLRFWLD